MTISIDLLRKDKGGDPDVVRASEKKRFRKTDLVDEIIELDNQWVKAKFNLDQKRKEANVVQKNIKDRKTASKGSDQCEDLLAEKNKLEAQAQELEKQAG